LALCLFWLQYRDLCLDCALNCVSSPIAQGAVGRTFSALPIVPDTGSAKAVR
jgi:hypothetical protein